MERPESQNTGPVSGSKTWGGPYLFVIALMSLLALSVNPASALPEKETDCTRFSPRLVPAKAAIVMDSNRTIVYAKNSDTKLPPASTTKLMTAMVVLDHLPPQATVGISRNASRVHSISPRLRAHEELTVEELLHLALMKSVNSAAVALAEEVAGSEEGFVELMNRKAEEIGAANTRFANSSGLPAGVQYTTVYDLTLIMNEAIGYPLIKEVLGKKECSVVTSRGRRLFVRNTNRLLWAADNMIGGKTGFTRKARHCFVGALETENGPVLTAVLGTPSRWGMWKSTETLLNLAAGPQVAPIRLADDERKVRHGTPRLKKSQKGSKQRYRKQAIRLSRKAHT